MGPISSTPRPTGPAVGSLDQLRTTRTPLANQECLYSLLRGHTTPTRTMGLGNPKFMHAGGEGLVQRGSYH